MLPKVLLVEDDETIREIYSMKFEIEGFPIATAENGLIGLEVLREFRANIILLDMMMPVMGGLEFMEQLKATGQTGPEVIVFSNVSAPKNVEEVMKLGASEYWIKSDYTPERVATELASRWRQRTAQSV